MCAQLLYHHVCPVTLPPPPAAPLPPLPTVHSAQSRNPPGRVGHASACVQTMRADAPASPVPPPPPAPYSHWWTTSTYLPKGVAGSTWADAPASPVIRVTPQQVTHGALVRHLINSSSGSSSSSKISNVPQPTHQNCAATSRVRRQQGNSGPWRN
jgi:hypothetical protein